VLHAALKIQLLHHFKFISGGQGIHWPVFQLCHLLAEYPWIIPSPWLKMNCTTSSSKLLKKKWLA